MEKLDNKIAPSYICLLCVINPFHHCLMQDLVVFSPLTTKFLVHKHNYNYGTNTKTECTSFASPSCTARSDPMIGEKKGNTEIKIHMNRSYIVCKGLSG